MHMIKPFVLFLITHWCLIYLRLVLKTKWSNYGICQIINRHASAHRTSKLNNLFQKHDVFLFSICLGAVFSVSFSEDSPFLLALAGSKGKLELWDTLSDAGVSKRYGKYARQSKVPAST